MFESPRYLHSAFSWFFPATRNLRASEAAIFDILRGRYFPSVVQPPLSENDPQILIFQSQHGHSQIAIDNTSATLNVVYSPDWQTKPLEGRGYVEERAHLLFDAIARLQEERLLFCGSVTRVRLSTKSSDEELVRLVAATLDVKGNQDTAHDVVHKVTQIVDGTYFQNITVQNYRAWEIGLPQFGSMRLSRHQAVERGVEILGDFNCRYAFNEGRALDIDKRLATTLIERNLVVVEETVRHWTELDT